MGDFVRFDDCIGMGPLPDGWTQVVERPLLILVGLTGTGKTTTVNALSDAGLKFALLPNRRALTDWVLIPEVQRANGEKIRQVQDRTQRFAYTRQYRQFYPGGMAYALQQLVVVNNPNGTNLLIFDGLRGANEAAFAAQELPQARFLFLDAPDFVRLQRLLQRNDAFDQVENNHHGNGVTAVAIDPALTNGILTAAQIAQLQHLIDSGRLTLGDVEAKLTIVQSERQNYDPQKSLLALRRSAPDRLIYADAAKKSPLEIAHDVINSAINIPHSAL